MEKLRVLDLFSGIGGFSLGLERTGGFETVAFCEIEEFPRRVLAKHWPEVPQYHDVRELTADVLRRDGIGVDVICGGFPCQDISTAGNGAGLEGERSGLWFEYARLIGELRPSFVIVDNVAALLGRGLERVLGSLAEIGYDAEWHCIPASHVGAPHRRDRIWIVAYPGSHGQQGVSSRRVPGKENGNEKRCSPGGISLKEKPSDAIGWEQELGGKIGRMGWEKSIQRNRHWEITSEPFVCRGTHGIPNRSHRLRGLGNAVVPQIPEMIGNAILASM